MTWDWSSPIALGLFIIMVGAGMILASTAIAIATGRAKVADFRLLNFLR